MIPTILLRALPATLLLLRANASPVISLEKRGTIDGYVTSQADVSIKGVLANIGSDGSKAQGAAAGIVVASPSKSSPDCKYT